MNVVRQGIRTGVLVLISLVVLVAALLYLGAPGVFVPMKTYWVYVQNAGGIEPGADVMLAGRRIGQVRRLYSPVPEETRPDKDKKMETLIEIRVERSAEIYQNVRVYVTQNGLLGETLLDFSSGSESYGLAPSGTYFLGERPPGISDAIPKVLEELHPALEEATNTLKSLQQTADSLNKLTSPGGEVPTALSEFKKFGINLNEISGPDSSLRHTLLNLDSLTSDDGKLGKSLANIKEMTDPAGPLFKTLKNAEKFTADLSNNKNIEATLQNLKDSTAKLDATLGTLGGQFTTVGGNLEQATDTVKHQPWRLVWPSTKKYPDDNKPKATPAPQESPKKKSRRSER